MTQITNKAPLEDLMAAMDVVDTLRHQQGVVDRELDSQGRRDRLLLRLKEMYQAQGIDVSEQVLLEGIDALEQERFSYTPTPASWRTKLAYVWVSRSRWGKPVSVLLILAAILWLIYFALEIYPQKQKRDALPGELTKHLVQIKAQAKNPQVVDQAEQLLNKAQIAIENNKFENAESLLASLQDINERLSQQYTVRVVSRPNQSSGVWRVPPGNSQTRNYYLIVEAVDRDNNVLELNIVNEENNKKATTDVWGLRVDESTFYKIASDKQDDGIIQGNHVGIKRVGFLQPEFSVPTSGATITQW